MAFEQNQMCITLAAAADLSSSQHLFVYVDANGKAALATDGIRANGVLQNEPAANQAASVCIAGVTKVVAGASITAGNEIAVDATTGRAAPATSGETILGTALQSANDGETFSLLLQIGGVA